MIDDIKVYKTNNLVLKVSNVYDPENLDISAYDRFITLLCGNRYYQKEAIKNTIIYLASGRYKSIEDLVDENLNNPNMLDLKQRYKNKEEYLKQIQLPNKLSCNIDLATGTGKSYVIYAIAQIMLSLGLVSKVIVLCPSTTIESGLNEKFLQLSGNSKLRDSLPENSMYKNPRIIDGNSTIIDGDICVENIHAIYENTNSSIKESLENEGEKVLILNDEAHHIFNKVSTNDTESKNMKRWKEFLLDDKYNFKYICGFTGTAYIDNDYFNDVIYRYSLSKAVEEKVIKMIDYVAKDDSNNTSERFQKIIDNHNKNKEVYSLVKPLSILITKDITKAKQLATEFKKFLKSYENTSDESIDEKVIIVTSHKDHKENIRKLKYVDNKDNPVEWIISVSMLTEGWDVKNVFQIVPWEDRAFNSRLLIAQVLGRGLRIPIEYQTPQPKVRVFNHESFSKNIKTLVEEILEIETKLYSKCLINEERSKYNFELYNIDYDKEGKTKESTKDHTSFDYTKGYIKLVAQSEQEKKETEYRDLAGELETKSTIIKNETFTVTEIVNEIYKDLEIREWEGKILKLPQGSYSKANMPSKDEIEQIIRNSMKKYGIKGDSLTKINRQKVLTMFSTLVRKKGKTTYYEKKAREPYIIKTNDIDRESLSLSNLRSGSTVFYSLEYFKELDEDVKQILQSVIDDDYILKSSNQSVNPYFFKTPVDIVFTNKEPERLFVKNLCKEENIKHINSWIKSRNQGFYSIDYSLTSDGGKHSTQHSFSPDFFIKVLFNNIENIVIVEIKSDDDISKENRSKLVYTREHFKVLNRELEERGINQKYIFHFLSPNSYQVFFDYLRDGRLVNGEFRSLLEDLLENEDLQ